MSHLMFSYLLVILVAFLLTIAHAQQCSDHDRCDSCVSDPVLPKCGWCEDKNPPNGDHCMLESNIESCNGIFHNPKSSITKNNNEFSDTVIFKPNVISAKLRPADPVQFMFEIKPSENYPVDLYYLMDLSGSMDDDLTSVRNNAAAVQTWLQKVGDGKNRIGFGSFVEKPDLDSRMYDFKNVLPLSDDITKFKTTLESGIVADGGLDRPECGLDALVQVSVCKDQINWRDGSRRIVFFTTDADYHYGADGKPFGIYEPNDGTCRLIDCTSSTHEYCTDAKGGSFTGPVALEQDYPSIGLVKSVLEDNRIFPIFAVSYFENYYEDLVKLLNVGRVLGLKSDSSNVEKLLDVAYRGLTELIKLAVLPDSPNVVEKIILEGGESNGIFPPEATKDKVAFGEIVRFEITLHLKTNMSGSIPPVKLIASGVSLNIPITKTQPCSSCNQINEIDSHCQNDGRITCGKCFCLENFYGETCDCEGDDIFCTGATATDLTVNGKLCNGHGTCKCGKCTCQKETLTQIGYSGRACECRLCPLGDVFDNPGVQEVCGGPKQGTCDCGKCICKDGFSHGDNAAQSCSCPLSNTSCMPELTLSEGKLPCNGAAECKCGKCGPCKPGYSTPENNCQKCDQKKLDSLEGDLKCPIVLECASANTCSECFDTNIIGTDECAWCPGDSELLIVDTERGINTTLGSGCYSTKGNLAEIKCYCDLQKNTTSERACNLHTSAEQCAGCEDATSCDECHEKKRQAPLLKSTGGVCEWCGEQCVEYELKTEKCKDTEIDEEIKCDLICLTTVDESTCDDKEDINSELLDFACANNGDKNAIPPNDSIEWPWCYSPSLVPDDVCELVEWVLLWAESCPKPVNKGAIIGGTIGGILGAALLALLAWKLFTHLQDKKEWAKWEEDRAASKWQASQNPLFKSSTQEYLNPIYN